MVIGERLRDLRAQKKMSQGDVERKTGLLRCYISRVENGHTVPAVQTLEKMAKALEVPMYQLFFEGKPEVLKLPRVTDLEWGGGKDSRQFGEFRRAIRKVKRDEDLKLLVFMAQKMSQKTERHHRKAKA